LINEFAFKHSMYVLNYFKVSINRCWCSINKFGASGHRALGPVVQERGPAF